MIVSKQIGQSSFKTESQHNDSQIRKEFKKSYDSSLEVKII